MKQNKIMKTFVLVFSATLIIVGCSQAQEPEVAVLEPTNVPPTHTSLPPTPTEIPPTETPLPPTETPNPPTETPIPTPVPPTKTPTPEPTEPLPEFQVMLLEEILGKWESTSRVKDYMKFMADGINEYYDRNDILVDSGLVFFEDGLFKANKKTCNIADAATGTVVTKSCIAIYKIWVSKDGDIPVCLRFEEVDDPDGMRASMITGPLWCKPQE